MKREKRKLIPLHPLYKEKSRKERKSHDVYKFIIAYDVITVRARQVIIYTCTL